jgi:hypothetical protein
MVGAPDSFKQEVMQSDLGSRKIFWVHEEDRHFEKKGTENWTPGDRNLNSTGFLGKGMYDLT